MMEVDVERLAKAIAVCMHGDAPKAPVSTPAARAVLANLTDQGFIVVRREDLETLRDPAGFGEARLREAMKQTRAALTAAPEEEE